MKYLNKNNLGINSSYDLFFNMYKTGDIIIPNVVAKYFSLKLSDAYKICDNRLKKDLKILYTIQCPKCKHILSEKYYSIVSIDIKNNYNCNNCNKKFLIIPNKDIKVYYEKI